MTVPSARLAVQQLGNPTMFRPVGGKSRGGDIGGVPTLVILSPNTANLNQVLEELKPHLSC